MSSYLITCTPAHGHVMPLLQIARHLIAGGDDVRFLTGARYADRANTVTLPGYARLDLTQTWKKPLGGGQSVEVQLAVRNLTDKAYYVSSHLHVARWVTRAQGRSVQLSTLYRF